MATLGVVCADCNGSGYLQFVDQQVGCEKCSGNGQIIIQLDNIQHEFYEAIRLVERNLLLLGKGHSESLEYISVRNSFDNFLSDLMNLFRRVNPQIKNLT